MFVDITDLRMRLMLDALDRCIEQLEPRRCEPAVDVALRYARCAAVRERAFQALTQDGDTA